MVADSTNRRSFIGGSDARIIMGDDETALLRLWREKRGEIEPKTSPPTDRPARHGDRGPQPALVRAQHRPSRHRHAAADAPPGQTLDGSNPRRHGGGHRARCLRPNSCCRGRSRKRRPRKSTWPSCSTTCGSPPRGSAVLSIITGGGKWVEMTIPADPHVPTPVVDRREEVLAMRSKRRATPRCLGLSRPGRAWRPSASSI